MAVARKISAPKAPFVLDGSIVLAWFFTDESNDYADSVLTALNDWTAVVPALFHLEVGNTLIVGERRRRCTSDDTSAFLKCIATLPITIDGQTMGRAWNDTMVLARSHNLSTYDAAYLELAMRESLPLASLDAKLREAAKAVRVSLFKP